MTAQGGVEGLGRHHPLQWAPSLLPCAFSLDLGGRFVLPGAQGEVGNVGPMAAQPFLKLWEEGGRSEVFRVAASHPAGAGRAGGGGCYQIGGRMPLRAPSVPEVPQHPVPEHLGTGSRGTWPGHTFPGPRGPIPPLPLPGPRPTSQRKSRISRMVSKLAPMNSPIWPPMSPVEAGCRQLSQPPAAPMRPQALRTHRAAPTFRRPSSGPRSRS